MVMKAGSPGQTPRSHPGVPMSLPMNVLSPEVDELASASTPFRLARLNKKTDAPANTGYKVWSRYGYEYYNAKPADLSVLVSKLSMPVQEITQEVRRANIKYPRFQQAMIAPKEAGEPRLYAYDYMDTAFISRGLRCKSSRTEHYHYPEYDPSPSPVSRSYSPSAKHGAPLHWPVHTPRHIHKVKKTAQGPCSREFRVTCMAPTNWMRMKWGRSKTSLV